MSLFDTIDEISSSTYLDDVFGDVGLLAQRFPGYESRPGQVALARSVDRAMRTNKHVFGEGPCGTGKGLSYLTPAAHMARFGKRTVIVTANNALSEQLVDKDLPLLASLLPWKFTFALLKGRENYYCRDRARASELSGDLADIRRGGFLGDEASSAAAQIGDIMEWAACTQTGDKSELPFIPATSLWSKLAVSSEDCLKSDCDFFEKMERPIAHPCFAETAKRRAFQADIIVTNYHLLYAHLSVVANIGQFLVLPKFDYLVMDEAHEAADIARDFFGFTVGDGSVRTIANYARGHMDKDFAKELLAVSRDFFDAVGEHGRSPTYNIRLRKPSFVARPAAMLDMIGKVNSYASRVMEIADVSDSDRGEARIAARQAEKVTEAVESTLALDDPNKVYFIDYTSGGKGRLGAKLVDVSASLREQLFTNPYIKSVSLVSATLTTEGNFEFIKKEVGATPAPIEVIAETPFDFFKQALLVVPDDVPAPDAPNFVDHVTAVVRRVIAACGGRTMCLFTSNKSMNAVHERIRGKIPYRLLKQGEAPRGVLSRDFKEDVTSVLLGTNSFWTGIDVPGEALTGLVIDKLPFPNKSDPVADAVTERDPKWFENFSKPRAIIMLRQGVGRLIRSQRDIGAVVILDRRLIDKFYKRDFFKSLPLMRRASSVDDVARFLGGEIVEVPVEAGPSRSIGKSMFDL